MALKYCSFSQKWKKPVCAEGLDATFLHLEQRMQHSAARRVSHQTLMRVDSISGMSASPVPFHYTAAGSQLQCTDVTEESTPRRK